MEILVEMKIVQYKGPWWIWCVWFWFIYFLCHENWLNAKLG